MQNNLCYLYTHISICNITYIFRLQRGNCRSGYNKKYSIKTIKYTNALLDRIDDDNHNYCYVEKDDINVLKTCSEVKMYTIKPMVVSNIFPFTYIKQNLENGKIFSLDTNSYTLKQLDLIIKYVRQKGYDFVTLEEILNEKINDKY